MQRRIHLTLAIVLALAVLVSGCSGTTASPAGAAGGTYVGRLAGTDAFVALVSDGTRAQAFYCDGTETGAKLWGWLSGAQTGANASLAGANGAQLAAQLGAQQANGTVTLPDGSAHNFQAQLATGTAGLYRADTTVNGQKVIGSWIVLPEGEQRGAVASILPSNEQVLEGAVLDISDGTSNTVSFGRIIARRYITPTF